VAASPCRRRWHAPGWRARAFVRPTRSVAVQTLSVTVDVPLLRWLGLLTWCLTLANTATFGLAIARCVDAGWEGPTGVT
jgi:hypothetical protein